MNIKNLCARFSVFLLVAVLFFSAAVYGPVTAADSYTAFPVSNYYELPYGNTGNNHYYDMAKEPRARRILGVGGGFQDLLLYEDARFQVQVLPRDVYSYGVSWHPEGNYALVVGSLLPPKSSGVVSKYTSIDTGTTLLKSVPENLIGVDYNEDGAALIVGGTISPEPSNVIIRYRNNQFSRLSYSGTMPLKTVDWRPRSNEALIVGLKGTILKYKGGTVQSVASNTSNSFFSVAWSPDGRQALIGGEKGSLYRWKDGYLFEVTTGVSWAIQDIAWHPSGERALVVGGTRDGEKGYWGLYQSLELSSHQLSRPFFSAEWLDEDNALIGGQKVLWRLSSNTDTRTLGLRPSISLKDWTVKAGREILASGFGSTAYGSVNRVSAFQFRLDNEGPSQWQNRVAVRFRLRDPGQHTLGLRIRDDEGNTSNWVTTSFQITGKQGYTGYLFNWSLYELIIMLVLVIFASLLIGWLFWEDLTELIQGQPQ